MALPKRLRLAVAQLGAKPGAAAALQRLFTVEDLPGSGWRQVEERTWRTGPRSTEWGARASAAGSISSWRRFSSRDPDRTLSIVCQVSPLVSTEEAAAAVAESPKLLLLFRHSGVNPKVLSEREEDVPTAAGIDRQRAFVFETDSAKGLGASRFLIGSSGPSVCLVNCAGRPDVWTWEEIATLLTRLASKANGQQQ
jgi:hypothetical protein